MVIIFFISVHNKCQQKADAIIITFVIIIFFEYLNLSEFDPHIIILQYVDVL